MNNLEKRQSFFSPTLEVGHIIYYRTFFDNERRVRVTGVEDEKNGQKVFIGVETSDGRKVWGYQDQITRNLGHEFQEEK